LKHELPRRADVVIVGGGIIGVSIACHLALRKAGTVVVLERGLLGGGTTAKCLGGLRTQFSTDINVRFSLYSREVFDRFEETFGVDPECMPCGYLFLTCDPARWDLLGSTARRLGALGVTVERLPAEALARRWPFLRRHDLIGGCHTPRDGFYGPHEVLTGFARTARRHGAILAENVTVTAILKEARAVTGVVTGDGRRIESPVVVNAAGPWSGRVAALAGLDLPVEPLRRTLFLTAPIGDLPHVFPFICEMDTGFYLKREGAGLILGGPTDAERSFSERVDFAAQEWTAERAVKRVPALERTRIVRGWAGHYELSPDHHGIIGEFPELRGFVCATGFSGHGFQHSPAVGCVVSELILDGRARTFDIHPLRPARFREGDPVPEPLTAFKR